MHRGTWHMAGPGGTGAALTREANPAWPWVVGGVVGLAALGGAAAWRCQPRTITVDQLGSVYRTIHFKGCGTELAYEVVISTEAPATEARMEPIFFEGSVVARQSFKTLEEARSMGNDDREDNPMYRRRWHLAGPRGSAVSLARGTGMRFSPSRCPTGHTVCGDSCCPPGVECKFDAPGGPVCGGAVRNPRHANPWQSECLSVDPWTNNCDTWRHCAHSPAADPFYEGDVCHISFSPDPLDPKRAPLGLTAPRTRPRPRPGRRPKKRGLIAKIRRRFRI